MKNISFLIKPASSSCNLKCRYCFYNDVSEHRQIKSNGMMQTDVMEILIEKACSLIDEDGEITFAFQGGEPTVAGLPYFIAFTAFVEKVKKKGQKIHYALQTNAYVVDEQWASFFAKYQFLVGISLDGYKENHDYFRLTNGNKATYKRVLEAIECLRSQKVEFNILTVLSKQLARHPKKLYDFYKEQKFQYIQLIPCLAGLDVSDDPFALTPQRFASFYKEFYDLWLKDFQANHYISVTLFDNVIPMYADIPPQLCGLLGNCSVQFVVESDGSIYPCDFYVLDQYCGGNIKDMELMDIAQSKPMTTFLREDKQVSTKCGTCNFMNICHGNCKRMNTLYFDGDYCGYQDFLMHSYPSMIQIANMLYRNK